MTMKWLRAVSAAAALLALGGPGARAGEPQGPAAASAPSIALLPVVTAGLAAPLFLTSAKDGSDRLFVVEQPGRVRVLAGSTLAPEPLLDLTDRVLYSGERGLLGLAFHPGFAGNGRFFVDYTRQPDGATVIAELHAGADPAQTAQSERILLTVPQPFTNHNGGMIAFGPDGYLYIAMGDGGSGGDPGNRAQNRKELLGKLLRLDVDHGQPYAIPAKNPYAKSGGRREIYALGFRNPWRFSFDRKTKELYAGDVGQGKFEEIDIVKRGRNYGWRIMEGKSCYQPASGCKKKGLTLPIATYGHEQGRCSITGGYVYRGKEVPALVGSYVYADFCTGEIFALRQGRQTVLLDTDLRIVSFGEDAAGELLVVDIAGTLQRIAKAGS